MSNPWDQPWSNSSTAPQISKYNYTAEKATLAGTFIGTSLYGLLTSSFFQCMTALLNPVHRREGIKWGIIFYTMAMFLFVTVYTAMNLHIQSISFIDNRRDIPEHLVSGPLYYQSGIHRTALGLIPNVMFNLNNWLADGLLTYRCYIIYSANLRVIAFPCLMYLASLGTGIVALYFQYNRDTIYTTLGLSKFGVPYILISVSLNVLLTLMIVIQLVLHGRNIRVATGSRAGISGLYKIISTMLIESCALFSVSSLLVVGPLAAVVYNSAPHSNIPITGGLVVDIFFPVLAEVQVIAALLIVRRVANRSALTGYAVTSGHTSLFKVRRQEELMDSYQARTGTDG